ncbi:ring-1,2-phenylacetyl-CoA epoxidase subunit PaaE [Krasilnikovia cinnamomea]|uniref:Ring-1,2-phenylacetyl-CoA epoxidase subunit PaaE n=1 Tax=Krasilnikovia cinnamomea TaxID=349313 RepID=A0A4Q7ZVB8_9ACTN|nr:1,2-phenylacetyl-CoA epoxidase subunit PaaE [Krasilnikovia cinnamomea]RZU54545.1 ring-1,2-phenylacetyl-CoA epoxidase subunit PaaE [Krasilnikovia cinnamomea]
MAAGDFHRLRVAAVERLCADAVAVTFDVPPELADAYTFRPGQSLTVRHAVGGADERRTYSICAPVGAAPRIGVREVPGGLVSHWLVHEVRPGDEVEVAGPSGTFTPDVEAGGRHVLIGAGSGITPLLSIAASLLSHSDAQVSILYGNRRAETVMFAEELADLKDAHPSRLELIHLLSREAREVELLSGRLDAAKLRTLLPLLIDVAGVDHWWLCGPFGLVADAQHVLGEFGVASEQVHRELFWVDEAPPEPVRGESTVAGPSSEVTVVLDGRSTTVTVAEDATILEGAQRSRPDLPFACKGGVCGTCRARVVEGDVRMRRNFALEPAEVAAGYVLTCQSTPTSAKVIVDFDD